MQRAKEIRTHTAIGACPVSVSSAAVKFAASMLPLSLHQANILLVGAGITMDLVLRHLMSLAPQYVCLTNRSVENAKILQQKYACQLLPLLIFQLFLRQADVVITATGSPLPVITSAMLQSREKTDFYY